MVESSQLSEKLAALWERVQQDLNMLARRPKLMKQQVP
jgi:hypothetical protein